MNGPSLVAVYDGLGCIKDFVFCLGVNVDIHTVGGAEGASEELLQNANLASDTKTCICQTFFKIRLKIYLVLG